MVYLYFFFILSTLQNTEQIQTTFNNSKNTKIKGTVTIDIAKMSNNLFGKFFSFVVWLLLLLSFFTWYCVVGFA